MSLAAVLARHPLAALRRACTHPVHGVDAGMLLPHHGDSGQRLAAALALPIAPDHERAVGIALAAHAHPARIGLEDARLEVRLNRPRVQRLLERLQRGELLPQVQRRHYAGRACASFGEGTGLCVL